MDLLSACLIIWRVFTPARWKITPGVSHGSFKSPPNPVPPGAFVELEALMDLICVVSSCPFDLAVDGWTINAGGGSTELDVDVA